MATSREKLQLEVNARDRASGTLKNIGQNIAGLAAAYIGVHEAMQLVTDSFNKFADYEADMMALERVVASTGRNMNDVYSAMEQHLGGVASKATIASGFLKGMTTTLTVEQINNLTFAIRDASIAMGEDFATQFPLIIKAIKQLNPAILDNIGVTVRLDQVNKKIREGFYGVGTEINEVTQQHAIYTEIMRQTQQFQGLEAELLDSTKGSVQKLSASWENLSIVLGSIFAPAATDAIDKLTTMLDTLQKLENIEIAREEELAWYEKLAISIGTAVGVWGQYGDVVRVGIDAMNDLYAEVARNKKEFESAGKQGEESAQQIKNAFLPLIEVQSAYNQEIRDWQKAIDEAAEHHTETTYSLRELEERDAEERFEILHQGLVEQNQAYEDAARERRDIQDEFNNLALRTTQRFTDTWIDMMFGMRVDAKRLFAAMAKDFIRFFIQEALSGTETMFIPQLLGFLGAIFDTPANDRLAMKQGQHYAQYFTAGMQQELKRANLGASISKSISIDAINRGILPQIEDEAVGGLSILMVDESLLTGQAHGFVN